MQYQIPYLVEHTAARYSCKVTDTLDLGTHILIVGEVTETEILSDEPVMTYDYYHRVVKGGTPPTAPSYKGNLAKKPEKKAQWRCKICGYISTTATRFRRILSAPSADRVLTNSKRSKRW